MKKRINYILFLFILLAISSNVYALSVTNNNLTIEKGMSESVTLYANTEETVSSVSFTLIYSTYDIPASFTVASGFSDSNPNGITHNITFNEPQSGKITLGTVKIDVKSNPTDGAGTITIHTAKATKADGSSIKLNNQSINVTIGTNVNDKPQEEEKKEEEKKEEKKDTNLLDKIESKLVNITLKENVFEYTVKVDSKVDELDLKAIPKDTNTKVEIGTQKISELKDNKIVIIATNGDIKQEYIINVKEKKDTVVTIDETETKVDTGYKLKWIVIAVMMIIVLVGVFFINNVKDK